MGLSQTLNDRGGACLKLQVYSLSDNILVHLPLKMSWASRPIFTVRTYLHMTINIRSSNLVWLVFKSVCKYNQMLLDVTEYVGLCWQVKVL